MLFATATLKCDEGRAQEWNTGASFGRGGSEGHLAGEIARGSGDWRVS